MTHLLYPSNSPPPANPSTASKKRGRKRGIERILDQHCLPHARPYSGKLIVSFAAGNRTMTTITIAQAGKYDGQVVTLNGWPYNLRESGKLLFPIFRDGTGIIQGVCSLKENPEAFESLKGLTQESSVIVIGNIRAEKRAPGGYEIGVTKIQVLQKVPESTPFPIQLKEHGVDFLLDNRHLWIRTPRQAAILRIRAEAIRAAREFMDSQGYTLTDAPMFTPAACEGT